MSDARLPAYLDDLNDRQREAVLHTGAPLLILAGAGSGKTRVITTKIAYALDVLGADPASILAVTFTNKAAAEMRERLARLTPRAEDVLIKTFHAFGAWVLRRWGEAIGVNRRFLIYDEGDSLALLKSELKATHGPAQIRAYLSLIERAKDLGLGPDADERDLAKLSFDREFPAVYARYEERLRATGNLDFGDLILHTLRLLRESPEARERLRRRFGLILVDEYQDSNAAQFALLRELASPSSSLVVVGDDDQSIYGFRGAEVENILTFPDAFPGTTVIRLEENYRSTRTILAAASAVVAHNKRRMGKTLVTRNEQGEPLRLALLRDYTDEALYAARLVEKNPGTETAILYRMNYQSRIFEEVFGRLGIPYLLVGSVRFYEREEVKDTLAYLSLMANPRDEVAAGRVLNKPARGIGERTEEKALAAAASAYGRDVLAACRDSGSFASGRAAQKLKEFAALLDELRALLPGGALAHVIHEVVVRTGLFDLYTERDKAEGTAKAKNLEELVNAATPYGQGEEALEEFLENTLLKVPEYGEASAEYGGVSAGRVTLITLHNTKGLEFDRVIISGLEEGIFPSERKDEDGDIEEERRLFYVGLTRARREIVLTACRSRLHFGQPNNNLQPSRFLSEIPPGLVVREDLGGGSAGPTPGRATGAWPPGTRVYSDDYGPGWVEKSEVKEGHEVVVVRFDTGRLIKILPQYHDLARIRDE
jgi:DNA helicase-2/ATP-dependent DNA helicase PcrA